MQSVQCAHVSLHALHAPADLLATYSYATLDPFKALKPLTKYYVRFYDRLMKTEAWKLTNCYTFNRLSKLVLRIERNDTEIGIDTLPCEKHSLTHTHSV